MARKKEDRCGGLYGGFIPVSGVMTTVMQMAIGKCKHCGGIHSSSFQDGKVIKRGDGCDGWIAEHLEKFFGAQGQGK